MKQITFICGLLLLAACSSDIEEQVVNSEPTEVTLTFSPYEVTPMSRTAGEPANTMAVTRAAVSIADVVTKLDVWIYESGSEVASVHQTSADDGFGTISVTLNKTKTYSLYAVGHKADGATLEDGVISFTNDKITHSMFYTTTFTPSTTTSLSCLMTRIVAQFRIETTDAIPDEAKKVQITINNVFDRWNVSTGGTHSLNRTSVLNIANKNNDGSANLNVYAIVTDAQTLHDVTIAFLDENDGVVITPRTFTDVPLRNGYKTTYRGAIKNLGVTGTFTVDDMLEYDVINF